MDEPGSKLGRDGLGAHATFARLAEEEMEGLDEYLASCREKMMHFMAEPSPDLESTVISAAIRFRKAESAAWRTSEVGTKEEAKDAKHERAMAYLDVVDSVDALIAAREKQK